MANPEHLAKLKEGVEAWNKWREQYLDIVPNLSDVDLNGADLNKADIKRADLRGAKLEGAKLEGVNLEKANLKRADLERANLGGGILCGANLEEANLEKSVLRKANLEGVNLNGARLEGINLKSALLSGCLLNDTTRIQKVKGVIVGINGMYSPETESAALMRLDPPGDSMLSNNPDSIIESLKSARKLHDVSLVFAGVTLLIMVLGLTSIPLPFFYQIKVDPVHFILIAIVFSLGLLILGESFLHSAYEAAQYIDTRDAAMRVGHFPWTLSKYDKRTYGKWITMLLRVALCAHPLIYLYFLYSVYAAKGICPVVFEMNQMSLFLFFGSVLIVYMLALTFSIRIFWLSQKFQKPILFDQQTERNRKSDAAILNEKVSELIELLKQKDAK